MHLSNIAHLFTLHLSWQPDQRLSIVLVMLYSLMNSVLSASEILVGVDGCQMLTAVLKWTHFKPKLLDILTSLVVGLVMYL